MCSKWSLVLLVSLVNGIAAQYTTSTELPITTGLPKADCFITRECDQIQELVDSAGNYLKSICVQRTPYIYDEAEIHCQDKGMKLFQFTTLCEKSSFLNFADVYFKNESSIWVDDLSGNCVALRNFFGTFKSRESSCGRKMLSACEFIKIDNSTSQTTTPIPTTTVAPPSTLISSTTTTPLTTTASPPPVFVQWVDVATAADVRAKGLIAGTDLGVDVFVGRAFHNGAPEPGELLLTPYPQVRYGNSLFAYSSANNIQYFNKDPNCDYQWIPSNNGANVLNAIVVNPGNLYIARLNAFNGIQVGKVGKIPPNNRFYYAHGDKELDSIAYYEVLVCNPLPVGK